MKKTMYLVTVRRISTGEVVHVEKCSYQAAHSKLRESLKPEKWPWFQGMGYVKQLEVVIEKVGKQ